MIRRKFKIILILFSSSLLALFLFVLCGFIYGVPSSIFSVQAFKIGYASALDKKIYLELYSPVIRDVGAGYIPSDIDGFLCQKIESTTDEKELAAIANFYTIQAGGREGNCIYKTSDQAKEKLTKQLIKDLDNNSNLSQKFILIEEIRRGESLGKGRLGTSSLVTKKPSTAAEWERWTEKVLPIGRAEFQEWWNTNLSWEEKKKIRPLEGTDIAVYQCCG